MSRTHASLLYDPSRGRIVLFGGEVGEFGNRGGVPGPAECYSNFCETEWEWSGSAWAEVTAPPAGPPSVNDVTPVYDPVRDRVVLFGGRSNAGAYSSDTDLWNGTQWAAATPSRVPPGRAQYGAAFVATGTGTAGYVVIADGADAGGAVASTATWDGTNWTTLAGGPSARLGTAVAQSTRALPTGGALLFGGRDDAFNEACDTWELAAGTWTRLLNPVCATTTGPPARYGHAMIRATGFTGQPVVLFGGLDGTTSKNDVWNYTGTWSRASAGGPAGATQPAPRTDHGLLFDTGRNRVLLWGGNVGPIVSNVNCVDDYGGYVCHDFWEWSGSAWARVFPVDLFGDGSPDPYRLAGMAFDTRRQVGVAIESSSGVGATLATWWWYGGSLDRPGQVMSVVFDAAGVLRPFEVVDLDVTWVGGASGAPSGTTVNGASLQIWDNTAWRPLVSSSTASPGVPEALRWSLSTDPTLGSTPLSERQRFMVGDQRLLELALVPAAASGSADGMGEVSTDYAEVTVRYRLAAP
jgi:hypothetical protein